MFDNALYERIGREMAAAAPPGWRELRLQVEAGDGYVDTGFRADLAEGSRSFTLPRDAQTRVEDALMDLRKDLRQAGEPAWTLAEMTLAADGDMKFQIKSHADQAG